MRLGVESKESGMQSANQEAFRDSVPRHCSEKVVCLQGDKILCQRIPTPRPALKIVLKDAWQVEQGTLSSKKTSTVEGNLFQIDLRIQKHPQNTVLQDQGRMTKIRGLVNKLRTEYRTESVITDLDNTKKIQQIQ